MARWLSFTSFVVAAVLLLVGAYEALRPGRIVGPALLVEQPERDLGEVAVGSYTVELPIVNASSQTRTILGVAPG